MGSGSQPIADAKRKGERLAKLRAKVATYGGSRVELHKIEQQEVVDPVQHKQALSDASTGIESIIAMVGEWLE